MHKCAYGEAESIAVMETGQSVSANGFATCHQRRKLRHTGKFWSHVARTKKERKLASNVLWRRMAAQHDEGRWHDQVPSGTKLVRKGGTIDKLHQSNNMCKRTEFCYSSFARNLQDAKTTPRGVLTSKVGRGKRCRKILHSEYAPLGET